MTTRAPAKAATVEGLVAGLRTFKPRDRSDVDGARRAGERNKLEQALHGAVAIEFATIPPYLTALWSIKDPLHPIAVSLRNIVQEEMLHLALASNMLAAIGGTPKFTVMAPRYPATLPLGVHPELTVALQGFSGEALDIFLEIERPDSSDYQKWLAGAYDLVDQPHGADKTIGVFYDEIRKAFHCLDPTLCADHQISGPLAWRVVKTLDDINRAIGIITHQGEGSRGGPVEGWGDRLAHFWRFAEMKELKKLVPDPTTGQRSFVTPIEFDMARDVWPVGQVPAGGYGEVSDPEVCRLLRGFNVAYSELLDLFEAAWSQHDGQAMLVRAIAVMFALQEFAKPLMCIPRPDDDKTYGPEFRYLPTKER